MRPNMCRLVYSMQLCNIHLCFNIQELIHDGDTQKLLSRLKFYFKYVGQYKGAK